VVTGEHAQTAGVDRERLMDAELGGEVGDEVFLSFVVGCSEPAGTVHVGAEGVIDAFEVGAIAGVGGGFLEFLRGEGVEEFAGVVADVFPAGSVQPTEEFDSVGVPDPPEVAG
jgi:hypothetical protein